jgi:hypothetical protein
VNLDLLQFGLGHLDLLQFGLGRLDLLQFGLGHLDLLQFGLVTIWTSEMLFPYFATVYNAISLCCYRS